MAYLVRTLEHAAKVMCRKTAENQTRIDARQGAPFLGAPWSWLFGQCRSQGWCRSDSVERVHPYFRPHLSGTVLAVPRVPLRCQPFVSDTLYDFSTMGCITSVGPARKGTSRSGSGEGQSEGNSGINQTPTCQVADCRGDRERLRRHRRGGRGCRRCPRRASLKLVICRGSARA